MEKLENGGVWLLYGVLGWEECEHEGANRRPLPPRPPLPFLNLVHCTQHLQKHPIATYL